MKTNKLQTVCFWCEVIRQDETNKQHPKTFSRYIKVVLESKSDKNGDTMLAYRLYGHKIVENKGLPLIKVDFVFVEDSLDGTLEQLAENVLNVPSENITSTVLIDEKMFDFMIEQQ